MVGPCVVFLVLVVSTNDKRQSIQSKRTIGNCKYFGGAKRGQLSRQKMRCFDSEKIRIPIHVSNFELIDNIQHCEYNNVGTRLLPNSLLLISIAMVLRHVSVARLQLVLVILTSLLLLLTSVAAFAPLAKACTAAATTSSGKYPPVATVGRSRSLYYRNDPAADDGSSSSASKSNNNSNDNNKNGSILTIPVLGPFPGHPPVMIGADCLLNTPTPMQWQSLEEAVYTHQQHLELAKNTNNSNIKGIRASAVAAAAAAVAASIDAAPLVAIMDEYTTGEVSLPGVKKQGRYATIAAVVGIRHKSHNNNADLDLSDASSFVESVRRIGQATTPLDSRIRLVGIGRAVLYDFFLQVPHSQLQNEDDEGRFIMENDNDGQTAEDDQETNMATNVVMAEFRLLTDSNARSSSFVASGRRGGRSMHASPVHALAEMSNLANKIHRIHQDRRRYVAGLQAAKSRLGFVKETELDLKDYDGLGMLFSQSKYDDSENKKVAAAIQPTIEQLLADFSQDAPVEHTRLAGLDNYGLGYSSASFSAISDVTTVWLEKLQPYFSPARCESEEHYFEVLSFVSVLSMREFLEPYELGRSLRCTNTIERLQQAYEWMGEHTRLLKQECEKSSQELRDCGEECTDLW